MLLSFCSLSPGVGVIVTSDAGLSFQSSLSAKGSSSIHFDRTKSKFVLPLQNCSVCYLACTGVPNARPEHVCCTHCSICFCMCLCVC